MVTTEKPEDVSDYDRYEVDGIEVFIHRFISARDGILRFKLRRFLFIRDIEVEGIRML